MPVTIKSSQVKVKGTDGYVGVDALADSTTASRVAAITSAGASALEDIQSEGQSNVSAIEQKGAEVLESIPDEYTQLENDVSSLKSALNEISEHTTNLLPIETITKDVSGVSFTYSNGVLVRNGTASITFKDYISSPFILEAGTYTFWSDSSNLNVVEIHRTSDNAILSVINNANTGTFTLSESTQVILYGSVVANRTYDNITSYIQLEVGTAKTTWITSSLTAVDNVARDAINATEAELGSFEDDITNTPSLSNRSGYYINASGVQGALGGYNLVYFLSEENKYYQISTKISALVAQTGNAPLVYSNGTPYGLSSESGKFLIKGNGRYVYVNTYVDYEYSIKEFIFSDYKKRPNFLRMYNNIVCCGDSLTYGQVWLSATITRKALVTYPDVVERITGATVNTLAVAGYTAKQWWENFNAQITGANKLYLIFLGTNQGLTDTVDADCVGDDYTAYADTQTGYYGRIIQKIKDTSSFCILIKIANGSVQTTNLAIEHLAARFFMPFVDNPKRSAETVLNDPYYHYGDTIEYANNVHFNDLGYPIFGEMLIGKILELPLSDQYSIMPRS